MKSLAKLFLVLLALLALLWGSPAMAREGSLLDQARLMTGEEQQDVQNSLEEVEKKHHIRLAVVTVPSLKEYDAGTPKDLADELLDKNYSNGENGSMILLLVMDSRDWYISTDTRMREKIVDGAGIDYLADSFLSDLKDGSYRKAFKNYASRSDEMMTYYEEKGKPYDPADRFNLVYFGLALLFALAGGMGARKYLIGQMSNVIPAAEAGAYLDRETFQLTHSQDTFLFMNVTRRKKEGKKERQTGSPGGGGSHGGGGGKF